MKIIKPGYEYEFDNGDRVRFRGAGDDTGVTSEEMLDIVLHRLGVQHDAVPHRATARIADYLRHAQRGFEARARMREDAGLTGSDQPHDPITKVPD